MRMYIYHGRLQTNGGASTLDGEPIDDWGFDGPTLENCTGYHCTYGINGYYNVFFKDKAARDAAFALTGWPVWEEDALTVQFSDDNDLIKVWSFERKRWEYFGDWGMKDA